VLERSTGTVIAGYRIDDVLGRGGMGIVYRATDVALERTVALKIIAPERAEDPKFRERFGRELRYVASIDHPNVIPVHHAGRDEGVLFIVMRYVDGTDLGALMLDHPHGLEPQRAAGLVAQVAMGLDAAHARGVVHRDVKPANVLIESFAGREHVYLTDFGLSRRMTSASGLTAPGQFVGTIDYVAPEQIAGQAADERADIYSLGCVLFHALTGQPPYAVLGNDAAKLWAHMHEPPASVSDLSAAPPAFDAVIRRAMAKERDERYQTPGELGRAALDAVLPLPRADDVTRDTGLEPPLAAGPAPPATPPAQHVLAHDSEPGPAAPTTDDSSRAYIPEALPAPTTADAVTSPPEARPAPTTGDHATSRPEAARAPTTGDGVTIPPQAAPAPTTGDGATGPPEPPRPTTGAGPTIPPEAAPAPAPDDGATSRPDRRVLVAAAALALVVVAAVAGIALVGNGGDATKPAAPAGPRVVSTIPVGREPADVTVGSDAVWVANATDSTLTRIDPGSEQTRSVRAGDDPSALTVGEGALWVADALNRLDRLHPRTGRRLEPPRRLETDPYDVAVDDGRVWLANGLKGTVTRLPARRGAAESKTIPVGQTPSALVAGAGIVWVLNEDSRSVVRIDAVTGEPLGDPIHVGQGPSALALAFGSVWVANEDSDTVTRIDALTGKVRGRPIRVGRQPSAVAGGADVIWVANAGSNTVSRIDPLTAQVVGRPIPVGKAPSAVAVGRDAVWVANAESNSVSRIDPEAGDGSP